MTREGRRIDIRGTVQGVGFRPWIYRVARAREVAGRVRNHPAGVTIEAFGAPATLDALVAALRAQAPSGVTIERLAWHAIPPECARDFAIVTSEERGERRVSIPPDLATCDACWAELFDPRDRRHRYPFTNCTRCGPRFTISRDVPYDRAVTTMAPFRMCKACEREYHDVADRRFHAEPNACPACGPRLRSISAAGDEIATTDPLSAAAGALARGFIVAIKGIGGFHLACDATSSLAVHRLRVRKRRDEKPFAVMVADLAAAERLAVLDPIARRLLGSPERPIVLLPRRVPTPIVPEVAPESPLLGLFLPYSPLHHVLLAEVGRPLVMTSANVAGDPIVHRDAEALERLRGIADAFVVHDREIETRCDDSVVAVIAARPVVLRRARGYVPRPLELARALARPVLACGGDLKNTFCVGVDDAAYLGPHGGDLESLESLDAFEEAIERTLRFLRVRPEVLAHDLHPAYVSTRYARSRPETLKLGVQHHHAHVASAMAEHGLAGPVFGVAYDGTGYGPDGAAWGGEVLIADYAGFERLATFRPIPLAGADVAIREVWRIALALLDDAFAGDPPLDVLPLFAKVPPTKVRTVRRMIVAGVNAPRAHGVRRYFDAIGSLVLGRPVACHEGQVALAWNLVASGEDPPAYPFDIDFGSTPWTVDLRALVRTVVTDLAAERPPATISARFHQTLVAATAELVRAAARRHGRLPVVLTGGCFQNARLAEGILAALGPDLPVYLHRDVPPGDGGLALGQTLVADARSRTCA